MTVLNLAGSQYAFGHVVYAVLEECEHRRRGFDPQSFEDQLTVCAKEKLAEIKESYDEIGGSDAYWDALEREVLGTAIPQYAEHADIHTRLESANFHVWRSGDLAARFVFALGGLVLGSIIIALPWIPIFEDMFAFALCAGGFFYPDLKRYMFERRYARQLNQIIRESTEYQEKQSFEFMSSARLFDELESDRAVKPSATQEMRGRAAAAAQHEET